MMRAALNKLDQILSVLADPRNDLALQEISPRSKIRAISLVRMPRRWSLEPAIDTALRSAYNALGENRRG